MYKKKLVCSKLHAVEMKLLCSIQYFCVEGWQCLINRANWLRSAAAAYCVHVLFTIGLRLVQSYFYFRSAELIIF